MAIGLVDVLPLVVLVLSWGCWRVLKQLFMLEAPYWMRWWPEKGLVQWIELQKNLIEV